jgi:hypothetical protein
MRSNTLPPLILLALLTLVASATAARLEVVVRSTARDVIYLDAGKDSGLSGKQQGSWTDGSGEQHLVEILFVSSGKASARPLDDMMPPLGTVIQFDVDELPTDTVIQDSLVINAPPLTQEAALADTMDTPSSIPQNTFWWRSSYRQSSPPDEETSWASRNAIGARGRIEALENLEYTLQLRHMQDREESTVEVDEASLGLPALGGDLLLGRFPGVGRAFPGALDGLSWSTSDFGIFERFELAAGKGRSSVGEAQPGAGFSAGYSTPLKSWKADISLFQLQGSDITRRGMRFQHRATRLPYGLSLVQWLRAESSIGDRADGIDPWQTGSRLGWSGASYRILLQHSGTEWTEPDNLDETTTEVPAARQHLLLSVDRRGKLLDATLFIEGRDDEIRPDMEALAGAELRFKLKSIQFRVASEHQLGPLYTGSRQSVMLRPERITVPLLGSTDLDLELRRWSWSGSGLEHNGASIEGGLGARLADRIRLRVSAELRDEDGDLIPAGRISLGGSFGK